MNPRKALSGNGPSPLTVLLFPFSFHLSLISFFLKDLILFQLTAESFGPSRHMRTSLSLLRLREVGEFIFPKLVIYSSSGDLKHETPDLPLDEIWAEFNPVHASLAQPQTRVYGSGRLDESHGYLIKSTH